ncbi:hypothetical protein BDN71DRAFT_1016048 [Pleurotus eryngii]|uniref:Uncharacterized protein n=1 Tax=Pleurotus eryngii TaxID=5323 RepID=A0A9P5ZVU6_PLEER|nr:hypothetical protein BDN71DRAFT_1016048 [Pleurotus eryngii]
MVHVSSATDHYFRKFNKGFHKIKYPSLFYTFSASFHFKKFPTQFGHCPNWWQLATYCTHTPSTGAKRRTTSG